MAAPVELELRVLPPALFATVADVRAFVASKRFADLAWIVNRFIDEDDDDEARRAAVARARPAAWRVADDLRQLAQAALAEGSVRHVGRGDVRLTSACEDLATVARAAIAMDDAHEVESLLEVLVEIVRRTVRRTPGPTSRRGCPEEQEARSRGPGLQAPAPRPRDTSPGSPAGTAAPDQRTRRASRESSTLPAPTKGAA
jgi:hypothetical protein